ncbi:MAG: hypothetical protein AB7L13_23720 [Acidimicrobiia bacterium]
MRGWLWLLVKDLIWLIGAGLLGLLVGYLILGWRKKWISTTDWEHRDQQLADIKAGNAKVEHEYRALVARNAELEAAGKGGGTKVTDLQAALDAAIAERDAALAAHADCATRISALSGEAGKLQPLVIDLTDKSRRIDALEAELATLKANRPHDDLNKIIGIGPVINQKLHDMGVHWFDQIAGWSDDDVDRIGRQLDFPGRIQREEWREQAREILAGTWDREKPGTVNT